ncbi:MAG: tryptophan 2,3-dioxygenase family protein, partial [Myxococcota bacterium]|nr:tryptophan 2,3-dioxygenase family protein [Myxococcota bacterium]
GDPLEAIRRMARDTETGKMALGRLDAALAETSVRKALHTWLYRTPIQGSTPDNPGDSTAVQGFVADYLDCMADRAQAQKEQLVAAGVVPAEAADAKFASIAAQARSFLLAEDVQEGADRARRIRAAILFIETYRDLPLLAWPRLLLDAIVETEEMLVIFRSRHARMVERVIGRRVGTGGSAGVEYLDRTTRYRIFTDLWAIRTLLLPRADVPPLQAAESYGFADG